MALFWTAVLAGIFSVVTPTMLVAFPATLLSGIGRARRLWFLPGFALAMGIASVAFAQGETVLGLDRNQARLAGAIVIGLFALPSLFPNLRKRLLLESSKQLRNRTHGPGVLLATQIGRSVSGFLWGAALAIVWSPTIGPILATLFVIAESNVNQMVSIILFAAYGLGVLLPLHGIGHLGERLTRRWPWTRYPIAALALVSCLLWGLGLDRFLQGLLLSHYPLGLLPL